ncbi:E3 ubiquitin protein ligase UPL1-like protein, partial [Tanacetum coccineum]
GQSDATNTASNANGIDPTFLEALPAHLRTEVLAQSVPAPVSAPAPTPAPFTSEEIDPGFQHCHLLYLQMLRDRAMSHYQALKEVEGDPLLNPDALKSLIRLLRLAQPLGKGVLQRLFLNLSAH